MFMPCDQFPFRYARGRSVNGYKARIGDIASGNGLRLLRAFKKRERGFHASDLDRFLREYLVPDIVAALKTDGHIPLSKERKRQLAKSVNLEILDYGSMDGALIMRVWFAKRNELPTLGIDVWRTARLRLYGGWVNVTSSNIKVAMKISSEIRSLFSRPLRKSLR
jgi:hypothetical protein